MSNIEKTLDFLLSAFENADNEFFNNHPEEKQYRLDHTIRVASLGRKIAENEGLDVEGMVIGCLLHDISYIKPFKNEDDWKNHGREAARLSRLFINSLELNEVTKRDIIYGIAIHVDDEADFDGERTVFAETIGECDNIDRFDKFRLYESLKEIDLKSMTLNEQISFCENKIKKLNLLKTTYTFKTATSNTLWIEKLDYQINYFTLLQSQLNTSYHDLLLI
ncbi:MAG: HD domain-containing protein [Clostridia bacterium]|nr:HD domain-containing protein [Clostridia bacterium]